MILRLFLALSLLVVSCPSCSRNLFLYEMSLPEGRERPWLSPELWGNRLQDWRLSAGRAECIGGDMPLRTIHLLTRSIGTVTGDINMSVRTGVLGQDLQGSTGWSGFLLGAGDPTMDYRARAIIHAGSGKNGGLIAAFDRMGKVVFFDNEDSLRPIPLSAEQGGAHPRTRQEDLELRLFARPQADAYALTLTVFDAKTGDFIQEGTITDVPAQRMLGNLALVAHGGADSEGRSFWFRDWKVSGSKVELHPNHSFGPILCALHTLSRGVLRITAQLPPIAKNDSRTVRLEIAPGGSSDWQTAGEAEIVSPGWTATIEVDRWDSTQDWRYRLLYTLTGRDGAEEDYQYQGLIRHDPIEKDEIVVAAFTGNSNTHATFRRNFDFTNHRIWFPHADLTKHVEATRPDFLVFTGDQVYETRPTPPDRSGKVSSYLDYLYKWYLWCWAYRDLARQVPTVCLPDDHDVYHPNIWGDGGHPARELPPDGRYPDYYKGSEGSWRIDGGGYLMPPEFVNMVQRTQCSHLPAPFDPNPVEQGITVYYTDILYGGISFAVLEDRKFKSAPAIVVPAAKVVNGFPQARNFDTRKADVPEARLLGRRQLEFLEKWVDDWRGAWMKVALSQTIFAAVSTYPESFRTDAGTPGLQALQPGEIPKGYRLSRDMDTNGWPQSGRNRALRVLRRGYALMIGGDQHLGSVVHHGVETWDNAGFSFCVPSVANLWPRRWYPPAPGRNRQLGKPAYTGRFLDGFGNHITVWAVSNPVISRHEPAELHDQAAGFGIARLAKQSQRITLECWPRYADPADSEAKQYPGWPLTIEVGDNYDRKAVGFLPTLRVSGMKNPVVQIIEESTGKVVYTRRIKDEPYIPKVFKKGSYQIKVGEPGTDQMKSFPGIRSSPSAGREVLNIQF